MTDFVISCLIDPAGQDAEGYTATYIIRIGGDEVYQAHLYRRPGAVLPSRFETRAAGFLPFEIYQTSKVGLRKIDVREAFAGARIGEIRGLKLYFDGPNQIVGLHDPAALARRLVRRALRDRPDRFIFQRAIDRAAIGWIETPPSTQGLWPLRILKGFKQSMGAEETVVWQGQLDGPDPDFRPFIAVAVILHSDHGYGGPREARGPRR